MIKAFLLCDSTGYPFYSKNTTEEDFKEIQPAILSGLISAINAIGKKIFNKEIARITFGEKIDGESITIISKSFYGSNISIYFIFISDGSIDIRKARELCSTIFIETKSVLKYNSNNTMIDIQDKIDRILAHKFDLSSI